MEVIFGMFGPCSHLHHLPRVQERVRRAFRGVSTLFAPPSPSLLARARQRWFSGCFDAVRAATCLARKSELGVGFYTFLV
jgi:hypothetical protein